MVYHKQHHGKQAVVEGSRLKTCDGAVPVNSLITDVVFAWQCDDNVMTPGLDHFVMSCCFINDAHLFLLYFIAICLIIRVFFFAVFAKPDSGVLRQRQHAMLRGEWPELEGGERDRD